MHKTIFLILVTILALASCSNLQETFVDTETVRISNNMMNQSFVSSDGDSLYFADWYINSTLSKMGVDKTAYQILVGDQSFELTPPGIYQTLNLTPCGDYIYFVARLYNDVNGLFRVDKEGGEIEAFNDMMVYPIIGIHDDYLYFREIALGESDDDDTKLMLYRRSLKDDFLPKELVVDKDIDKALLLDDGILTLVYEGSGGDTTLCAISFDGEIKRTSSQKVRFMVSDGTHVVFENSDGIFIMDYETLENPKKIAASSSSGLESINICGGYVYFLNPADKYKLYRYGISDSKMQNFCDAPGIPVGISIVNNCLYYYSDDYIRLGDDDPYDVYHPIVEVKLDGSGYQLISSLGD